MIGNTFSQMANAEKLSPQQLQLAIQHGTVPSYIGIPLLQEKLKQSQEAQALAAGQQKPPTIAQQVMQQAQAQHGVEALPSGLPEEAMAGGGIVAFADGGMSEDDDYEDYLDEQENAEYDDLLNQAMEYANELRESAPVAEKGTANSYQAVRATPNGGEFEALALEKNKAHGVDERLLKHVLHKETGGMKDRANAVSPAGAQGVMQLMPATAKDLGVRDAFNPEQNIEGGVKYLAQLERKYHDPKLAAMAYNWGTGNVDKWLMAGADPSKLPRETRGYVQGLAKGGAVQHYVSGDLIEEADLASKRTTGYGLSDAQKEALRRKAEADAAARAAGAAAAKSGQVFNPSAYAQPIKPATPSFDAGQGQGWDNAQPVATTDTSLSGIDLGGPGSSPANMGAPAPTSQADQNEGIAAAPKDRFAKYEDIFNKREENLAKQREQDKYMALLSAGLGMMGGTSPNALANIGAGGQQGLASLLATNKDRTAEENAILSGRLGLEKIGAMAENQRDKMALSRELANQNNARLTQANQELAANRAERLTQAQLKELNDSLQERQNQITKNTKLLLESTYDPEEKKKLLTQMEDQLNNDEQYRNLYKQRWGSFPGQGAPKAGGSSLRDKANAILGR